MKILLKGESSFIKKYNNWSISVDVKWNKRITKTTIKSKKLNLKSDFKSCKLNKNHFLTLLSYSLSNRSESYSFSGSKSEYSDIILKSIATMPLMQAQAASIKLEGKNLIFSGGTRKKDIASLSNIFKLNEILLNEIDQLDHNSSA